MPIVFDSYRLSTPINITLELAIDFHLDRMAMSLIDRVAILYSSLLVGKTIVDVLD